MGSSTSTPVKLFERLFSCLIDSRRIPEANVDAVKGEYASFIQEVHDNPTTLQKFKEYDLSERVDCFLASHLKKSQHQMLWDLLKCLLVLSHGQAGVLMEYNFKERSVISQRVIYDHIQAVGGIFKVDITQPLRNAVKRASTEYHSELRKQKEESKKKEKEEANKQVSDEISSLQVKRKRLLEHCSALRDSSEKLCYRAEKEDNMIHLRKANSYRRTIKDMQQEADELHVQTETLKKKLKY